MKNLITITLITFFLTGCKNLQQITDRLTLSKNGNEKISLFDWKKNNSDSLTVNEKDICSLFRKNPNKAREEYIGKELIHNGDVSCIIQNPLSFSIDNVVSIPTEDYMKSNVKISVRNGSYLNIRGKILRIENYSTIDPNSDCEISIKLSSMNQL